MRELFTRRVNAEFRRRQKVRMLLVGIKQPVNVYPRRVLPSKKQEYVISPQLLDSLPPEDVVAVHFLEQSATEVLRMLNSLE